MKNKLLIVDDDQAILNALDLFLTEEGYLVQTANNHHDLMDTVKTFQPDLIFLDLLLSGKEGSEICLDIKNNYQTQHIPVILISAHPKIKHSAIACKADGFLEKPFDLDLLIATAFRYTKDSLS